jgi:hypothetical protein
MKRGAVGKYPKATDKEIDDIVNLFNSLMLSQIKNIDSIAE